MHNIIMQCFIGLVKLIVAARVEGIKGEGQGHFIVSEIMV